MLPVVLLPMNATALLVLGLLDPAELAPANRAVGERAVFHPVDVRLPPLEAGGLARVQLARPDALVDAVFLAVLAPVDDLLVALGQRGRNGGQAQRGRGGRERQ